MRCDTSRPESQSRSGGRQVPKRGSRTFPSSSARWRGPASRDTPERGGPWRWTRRSSTRPASSSACEVIELVNSQPPTPNAQVVESGRVILGVGNWKLGFGSWELSTFARPYVVSWNLTYRCNLACEHCYLDAGGTPLVDTESFADRSELGTEECFRVIDEIAAFAPECVTILTGGEPLLRRDILEIVRRAAERELWVVVGTNGVRITENLARRLAEAGARGLSLSLDALDPDRHDRFRKVRGAWRNTVEGAENPATGPGSPSSCRRPRARTISASSRRSPTSRTIASPPRSGTSTSWCRPGAGSSCRTSPPRSTTTCSRPSTESSGSTTAGCS